MRIAIVSDAASPQVNGVVVSLTNTIANLKERGHDVLLIHPYLFKNFPCPSYPEIGIPYGFSKLATDMLDSFKPDAIHIPVEGVLGWWARRYCMKRDIAFTTAYHTDFPAYLKEHARVPRRITEAVMRHFHGAGLRCMVSNRNMEAELHDMGIANTVLWGRGVDTNIFSPTEKPTGDYVMFAGRVSHEKNLRPFLDCHARLKLDGYRILIAGDGPARVQLEKEYPEVEFVGMKTQVELAKLYRNAAAFVFPSRSDTFGLVMAEAAACGAPVAAYPVTGPMAVLKEDMGVMEEDLYHAIRQALYLDRTKVAAQAREHYSWAAATDQFEAAIVQL